MKIKLHEKIKKLILEKGWSLSRCHREIKNIFKDKTIAYLTLYRTVQGTTEIREKSLFQISKALQTLPEEIKKDTDKEEQFSSIRFNENAQIQLLSSFENILVGKLVLNSGATTSPQQDSKEKGTFRKWVYIVKGKLTCVILNGSNVEKKILNKDDYLTFASTTLHYFENNSNQKTIALLIQNPKS